MPTVKRVQAAALVLAGLWLSAGAPGLARAQSGEAAPPKPEPSSLDAPLFYQLLIGELELRSGDAGDAYEVLLDAARRTKDDGLFKRAIDIALQARAGEQALGAVGAWRTANPESLDALRYQVQLLMALNRMSEVSEPLTALLAKTPVVEQPAFIASLPRFFQRSTERRETAQVLDRLLQPYLAQPSTRTAARVALGRAWLTADDAPKALALAQSAQADDPASPGPALLALELLPTVPTAETVVTDYLSRPGAEAAVRLAYVRALSQVQRYGDAAAQLGQLTTAQPDLPGPWLTLGALQLELKQPAEAQASLERYIALRQNAPTPSAPEAKGDDDDDGPPTTADSGEPGDDGSLVQAWLLLAQAAEQQKDFKGAEAWLAKVDSPQRALEVQAQRAGLLARQGQLKEARELIRRVPEREPQDARAKLLVEAQLLREVRQYGEAHAVLARASERFPNDADLLYEQAMVAEKLDHVDEMEALLRRVITIKPDHQHAYNALGYSLADRNQRLPEARQLIGKALELSPGDPFITDSLGWVEYRLGNRDQAVQLLRKAYAARPDTEIATHLGEVLWSSGQRDEARRVWRDANTRDGANELLRETLARLKVDL